MDRENIANKIINIRLLRFGIVPVWQRLRPGDLKILNFLKYTTELTVFLICKLPLRTLKYIIKTDC